MDKTPEHDSLAITEAAEILGNLQKMSPHKFIKLKEANPQAFHKLFGPGAKNEVPRPRMR